MEKIIITPKTKLADLLNSYPELEDLLIEMAPKFSKLQNPVLRETIARVTTLSQAAIMGGVKVENLVSRLREAVGQDTQIGIEKVNTAYIIDQPDWFDENQIIEIIDTREMLNKGEHPIHIVLSAIKNLPEKGILKVMVPFIPAPMIDKTQSLNYKHWLKEQNEHLYFLYFSK